MKVSAGNVSEVKWSVGDTAIATATQDKDDLKKATITGVAEGETKVTAEVKVTVEGENFTVKAEGTIHVSAKDALVINATIESATTELEITKSAEMSVKVDVGDEEGVLIDSIEWGIKGTAATIETSAVEKKLVTVHANEIGDVTLSVTVKAHKGEKEATDTKEITIHVTPITYNIGKKLTCNSADWAVIPLDTGIQIKKTDLVDVVFSVKSGGSDDKTTAVKLTLCPKVLAEVDNNPHKIQEVSVLRVKDWATGVVAGTAKMERDDIYFTNNYATIKSVAGQLAQETEGTAEVTLEKILVTPTNDLAYTIHAPGAVEKDKTATIQVEVDEADFTSIEWVSDDETKATVAADPQDQRNGIVTGIGSGEVTITVKIKKDGTVIGEKEVKLEVRSGYKNDPKKLNLRDNEVIQGGTVSNVGTEGIKIDSVAGAVVYTLPYPLKSGEKLRMSIKGSLEEGSAGFRVYTTPADDKTKGGSNTWAELVENVPGFKLGDFEVSNYELTATMDCTNIIIRMPGWGLSTGNITGVTITEFTVEYI